jgi:hypothetical protein
VRNTIISSNTANTSNPDVAGSLSSIDHNLIGGNEPLGPLTDNGGRTDTMALLAGSAAINGGNDAIAPKLDQRGYLRGGISDIGAFESGGQPLRITSITHPDSTHILLQGVGVPNALHTVQVSVDPNGTNFGALTSIMTNGSGQWQYNDTPSAGQTKLFYRLTFP